MGITCHKGRYYWVKRVPKGLADIVVGAHGQPVSQVRVALKTDSLREAKRKAPKVEAAKIAEWNSMKAADGQSAREHYLAAKRLAEASGFEYRTVDSLAEGTLDQLVSRVLSLIDKSDQLASREKVAATLGAVPVVLPELREVLDQFISLTKTRHLQKSEMQKRRWLLPRQRAVRNFLNVSAGTDLMEPKDIPVNEITRKDAIRFRDWWSVRVEAGMNVETANKDLMHLSQVIGTWTKLTEAGVENPFKGLRLEGKNGTSKPSFNRNWVETVLLKPGAFDRLNDEARDVFFVMINTGLRPSEITCAPVTDFRLEHEIPHLCVRAHGRELKVAHTAREIPLLGVSLAAAKRIVRRGGIQRYGDKTGSWSAVVNKYLKNNDLKESPTHVAYSLRHYVENALLAAKVDDRVRADILGHKYARPKYGDGGGLLGRRDALKLIAI